MSQSVRYGKGRKIGVAEIVRRLLDAATADAKLTNKLPNYPHRLLGKV